MRNQINRGAFIPLPSPLILPISHGPPTIVLLCSCSFASTLSLSIHHRIGCRCVSCVLWIKLSEGYDDDAAVAGRGRVVVVDEPNPDLCKRFLLLLPLSAVCEWVIFLLYEI